jgi:hypothetical protein
MRKGSRKQRWHSGRAWEKRAVAHARNSLGERYGLHISEEEYWALVRSIHQPRAGEPAARRIYQANTYTRWYVLRVEGQPVLAVYDQRWERIPTFLALEALGAIGLKAGDVA